MIQIDNMDSYLKVMGQIHWLHDSLIKQIEVINPAYVDSQGSMFGDMEAPNMALLVQSQFTEDIPAMLIWAEGVTCFKFEDTLNCFDILDPIFSDNKILLATDYNVANAEFYIQSKRLSVKFLGADYIGDRNFDLKSLIYGNT